MISSKQHQTNHKNIFIFFLILFVFACPLIIAFYLAKHPGKLSQTTTNKGELIIPMIPVEDIALTNMRGESKTIKDYTGDDLRHKWLLIFSTPNSCNEHCIKNAFSLNQIHAALGKKSPHFIPIYVNNESSPSLAKRLQQQFPRVTFVRLTTEHWQTLQHRIPTKYQTTQDGAIYLIDPRGNMMMYYTGNSDGNDILSDVGRLLKE